MTVIKFPPSEAIAEPTAAKHEKMYLGAFSFTCPCGTKGTFEPNNIIFRSLEMYCLSCGTPHKLMNPAFANTKK